MTDTTRWSSLLLDIEARTEQVRQIKPRRLVIQAVIAFAAAFAAGGVVGGLLVHVVLK